jgi:hypothetical protein
MDMDEAPGTLAIADVSSHRDRYDLQDVSA